MFDLRTYGGDYLSELMYAYNYARPASLWLLIVNDIKAGLRCKEAQWTALFMGVQ